MLSGHQTGEETRTSREDGPDKEESMNKGVMRTWGGAELGVQV